jgi:hypothetical protein
VVGMLVLAIVVLVLAGLLVVARSRVGTDPSSSVAAFNRALTAMEPGAGRDSAAPDADGSDEATADGADEAPAEDRAHPAR